jgi:hypothetical protein
LQVTRLLCHCAGLLALCRRYQETLPHVMLAYRKDTVSGLSRSKPIPKVWLTAGRRAFVS